MTSQEETRILNFVSWNTSGIKNTHKSPEKFLQVLNTLRELQADVVFLQETRVGPHCCKIFDKAPKDWNVYFTVHSSSSKGVAILIKDVSFEYICHDEDSSGGYIVLFCYLHGELYTLVNVYNHKGDKFVLGRLKEYLRETAEGVLVVGGDFNTVLHPGLDRKPSTSRHSPFRAILDDFVVSLNLKDIWSYLYPTSEGFTRHQKVKGKESYSRLDMFFMPEDKLEQVHNSSVKKQDISDHNPLVLNHKVARKTNKQKKPNVAEWLEDYRYKEESLQDPPDRIQGMISGAEILSVIKSLSVSEESRPDQLDVKYYKTYCCPLSEILKIKYNKILIEKHIPKQFNEAFIVQGRHIFCVEYLIFSQILANRLSALITPSFKQKAEENLPVVFSLTFEKGEQEIESTFLSKALDKLKQIPSEPLKEFTILDYILPKVEGSINHRRLLLGCPLTNAIVNLSLNYLKESIFEIRLKCAEESHIRHKRKCKEVMFRATVCYQRQILWIHTRLTEDEKVHRKVNNFKEQVENSGLKYTVHINNL